ncbi:MAG TPA: single-stranded DNA-binding protein [Methylovirgula sp.]|nr:single-stranded DNA-binding protein [Methylovirgula sp.]
MSVAALVLGNIFRKPEERTSKSGTVYVTATIKASVSNEVQFWRVSAFSDRTRAELLRLDVGDGVSAQGALKAEIYQPIGGEPRVSLSIMADHVIALRQPARQRESAKARSTKAPARSALASAPSVNVAGANFAPALPFDDDVPF